MGCSRTAATKSGFCALACCLGLHVGVLLPVWPPSPIPQYGVAMSSELFRNKFGIKYSRDAACRPLTNSHIFWGFMLEPIFPLTCRKAAVSELFGIISELIRNKLIYSMGVVSRFLKSDIYIYIYINFIHYFNQHIINICRF